MSERSWLERRIRARGRRVISLTELEQLLGEMDDLRAGVQTVARAANIEANSAFRKHHVLVAMLASIETEAKRAIQPGGRPHAECMAPSHGGGHGGCLCLHLVLRDLSLMIGCEELK